MSSSNPPTVISALTSSLTTFSRPFARFNLVPVGGRSVAVQLNDKQSVWVMASTPLDSETKETIKKMGDVKYIVAPDAVHHLYIAEYSSEWPDAKVIGVEGLEEKRKDVKWSGIYGKDPKDTLYGFENEIAAQYFPTFANKDVAFLHKESGTLILADLLFNLPANEQYSSTKAGRPTSYIPFMGSLSKLLVPSSSLQSSFLWRAGAVGSLPDLPKGGTVDERRSRFAKDAEVVAGWDFERIVMCHGDVIEKSGKKAWLDAFGKYLTPEGKAKVQ